ncbi:MAG TPA: hypothetical protein VGJ28_04780 [Micromonosporaceae bacterium]|jgi:hypothetical protein
MTPLAKKLGIKAGHRILVIGGPEGLLDDVERADDRTAVDCVLIFAADSAALPSTVPDTERLWIAYPKGGKKAGTDLNRDILHAAMSARGLNGVSLVAVDDVWSAMRFRPA